MFLYDVGIFIIRNLFCFFSLNFAHWYLIDSLFDASVFMFEQHIILNTSFEIISIIQCKLNSKEFIMNIFFLLVILILIIFSVWKRITFHNYILNTPSKISPILPKSSFYLYKILSTLKKRSILLYDINKTYE